MCSRRAAARADRVQAEAGEQESDEGGRPTRLKIRPSANAAEIQTTSTVPSASSTALASYTSRPHASRRV